MSLSRRLGVSLARLGRHCAKSCDPASSCYVQAPRTRTGYTALADEHEQRRVSNEPRGPVLRFNRCSVVTLSPAVITPDGSLRPAPTLPAASRKPSDGTLSRKAYDVRYSIASATPPALSAPSTNSIKYLMRALPLQNNSLRSLHRRVRARTSVTPCSSHPTLT